MKQSGRHIINASGELRLLHIFIHLCVGIDRRRVRDPKLFAFLLQELSQNFAAVNLFCIRAHNSGFYFCLFTTARKKKKLPSSHNSSHTFSRGVYFSLPGSSPPKSLIFCLFLAPSSFLTLAVSDFVLLSILHTPSPSPFLSVPSHRDEGFLGASDSAPN